MIIRKINFITFCIVLLFACDIVLPLVCKAGELRKKQPDERLYNILSGLDEKKLDEEVSKDPQKFLNKYKPLFGKVNSYTLSNLSKNERYIIGTLYNNLGTGNYRISKYDEAIKFLKLSIEIDPEEMAHYRNLGLVLANKAIQKNSKSIFEDSIKIYETILTKDKNNSSYSKEAKRTISIINNKYLPNTN